MILVNGGSGCTDNCDVKRVGLTGGGGGAGRLAIIGDLAEIGETVTLS